MSTPETALDRKKKGLKAKRSGQRFEEIVKIPASRDGIEVIQIPSGARWVPMRGGVRAIPTKTPFDFVMCRDGIAVFFDAKSTSAKNFTASSIQLHQLYHLARVENAGFRSGYVVYFQGTDEVVFFSASQLASLKRGDSLKSSDGLMLGSALTLSLLPLFFN
jgi:hypothetical protein